MVNKKGLSGIVTTVLVILLALAAVTIIASYILSTVSEGSSQIGAKEECTSLILEPSRCIVTGDTATLNIKRLSGDAEVNKITAVFADGTGITTTSSDLTGASNIPSQGETKSMSILSGATNSESVAIFATIITEQGQAQSCTESKTITCITN